MSYHNDEQDPSFSPGKDALTAEPADIQQNKWIAAAAYILFFLPLLAARQSRFAMYHGNQGLVLLLLNIVCNIVLGWIPFIGLFLVPLANLATLVLAVIGIVQATGGQLKPLPIIGTISILKVP
ncbi:Chloroplast import component protein (Tic20) [Paenibacillus konkukensis]|uniref:Chloroplast import component protein (Tic20) n=1 Tax=Paenibacillus konkukensis TaxID=2020716 RepID=A0ABY4RPH7_9BACL|nr:Chloroplast import component protein (Tic20) [Paenibacillus konkukensis]